MKKSKSKFHRNTIFVIHWDGKLTYDLIGQENFDEIVSITFWKRSFSTAGCCKIFIATGYFQSAAVFKIIQNWGITDNIPVISFDIFE